MKKYKCWYGLGGGFGGVRDYEIFETESKEVAEEIAYDLACEYYERYTGLYGLRTIGEIMEQEECDEEDADIIFCEERESWLDYHVEETNDENEE